MASRCTAGCHSEAWFNSICSIRGSTDPTRSVETATSLPKQRNGSSATMMGKVQEKWPQDGLSSSTAQWNVIAQQIYMASFDLDPGPGEMYSMDKWDGYPAARNRLMAFLSDRHPSNPV